MMKPITGGGGCCFSLLVMFVAKLLFVQLFDLEEFLFDEILKFISEMIRWGQGKFLNQLNSKLQRWAQLKSLKSKPSWAQQQRHRLKVLDTLFTCLDLHKNLVSFGMAKAIFLLSAIRQQIVVSTFFRGINFPPRELDSNSCLSHIEVQLWTGWREKSLRKFQIFRR
jgi:hypothetical protein